MPTVAFNFRKVRKGNIVLKIWDVAGASMLRQPLVLSLKKDSVDVLEYRPTKVPLNVGTLLQWS